MKKMYSEAAYLLGLLCLAAGTTLMERADYGISMVVAPAYLIYLKVSEYILWFTFGMAEYCFQALLIVVISLVVGRFKKKYLFSFVTAFIYGNILDLMMKLFSKVPGESTIFRVSIYVLGMLVCAVGVSLLFHTYIAPEAYELFVKEYSDKYRKNINKVKTVYDCISCLFAVILSFIFMGLWHFEGVKLGTILTSLVNGWLIGRCSRLLEKKFVFQDAFHWRSHFD